MQWIFDKHVYLVAVFRRCIPFHGWSNRARVQRATWSVCNRLWRWTTCFPRKVLHRRSCSRCARAWTTCWRHWSGDRLLKLWQICTCIICLLINALSTLTLFWLKWVRWLEVGHFMKTRQHYIVNSYPHLIVSITTCTFIILLLCYWNQKL